MNFIPPQRMKERKKINVNVYLSISCRIGGGCIWLLCLNLRFITCFWLHEGAGSRRLQCARTRPRKKECEKRKTEHLKLFICFRPIVNIYFYTSSAMENEMIAYAYRVCVRTNVRLHLYSKTMNKCGCTPPAHILTWHIKMHEWHNKTQISHW